MQAEAAKHSPRMVITPRQIQDNSEEVRSLKAGVAALKDEVICSLLASLSLLDMHAAILLASLCSISGTALVNNRKRIADILQYSASLIYIWKV